MKISKKAFTMVELIFVIVIIGILSAVAIPRLAATRDDAKVSACTENITIFMRDVSVYYTSQGEYALDMKDMSSVEVYETTAITKNGDAGEYYFVCDKTESAMTSSDAAVTFKFSKVTDALGNKRINLNATMASITQGTVDGDLGYLLDKKHIATTGSGIDHAITGIRTKR
jgi:prepilin-type N-terminal cleavage/methylation domain-containing protein